MSEEVEHRLERSFSDEDLFVQVVGGPELVAFLKHVRAIIEHEQQMADVKGSSEDQRRKRILGAIEAVSKMHFDPDRAEDRPARPRSQRSARKAGEQEAIEQTVFDTTIADPPLPRSRPRR